MQINEWLIAALMKLWFHTSFLWLGAKLPSPKGLLEVPSMVNFQFILEFEARGIIQR